MTRYARGNKGNQKRPHEASSWADLKGQGSNHNQQRRTQADEGNTSKRKQQIGGKAGKRRKKTAKRASVVTDEHRDVRNTPDPESVQDNLQEEDPFSGNHQSSLSERLATWKEESVEEDEKTLEVDGKKDRRREKRRLKRIKNKANKMVCYHCRETGHGVADCPKMLRDEEQGVGICFRCGSTEHEASRCTAKVDPAKGDFPFAKCFICQEAGHLSRSCPDNPRGLYPLGGGCRHCGSVEHRSQHCHGRANGEKQVEDTTLPTLSSTLSWSADAEIDEIKGRPVLARQTTKRTPKVVKF